jgi:Protein of unknown function (DUF3551)
MSKIAVRLSLASIALVLLAAAQSKASAQGRYGGYPPKYCLRAYDGAMECAYLDRQQCQVAARGTGGDCAINPRFAGYPDPRAPRWKRVYR